eukprot:CAMPEP_0172160902 /NCGR_PEP_ID=MMETSP1050-20130122/5821_1 /TAXON_ID=233186 /ORGANISM="Cryptomonas curvata, Strain CCAP979/52" /LENGTH=177 /DNA_ID=CAMNT_0012830727 /DNA_START=85 /DNA_END=615 /DNA_ORIENTATION=-
MNSLDLLRFLVKQDPAPASFEYRHFSSPSSDPSIFQATFSDDWTSIIDSTSGQHFRGLMAWAVQCKSTVDSEACKGISVKRCIHYKGKNLHKYEREILAQHVRNASTAMPAASGSPPSISAPTKQEETSPQPSTQPNDPHVVPSRAKRSRDSSPASKPRHSRSPMSPDRSAAPTVTP